ncbi:MAG: cache domain-containing protein [Desulfobacteraceae bacterium]|nr:cache domain-containing protein [Desulfobacteraceae bacterium]
MKTSLKTKLVTSFLAVILICGLVATLVGTRLIGTGIIRQAQDKVEHDLNSGREVYREEMENLKDVVRFTALRFFIKDAISDNDIETLRKELQAIRQKESLDILTLTDEFGRVIVRAQNPSVSGDNQTHDELVDRVLSTKEVIVGTVIISREKLVKEGVDLAEQAHTKVIATPKAKPGLETEQTSAMCIKAAAPVFRNDGSLLGILYGGNLLNQNHTLVDKVKEIAYRGVKYKGEDIGTSTIFQGDVRISTNVKGENGSRAIGTRLSQKVYEQVLEKGLPWTQRAFVVNNWYIAAYEPIKNPQGDIIGVLSVSILEDKFTDMRKRAIAMFLGITLVGMIVALIVSNFLARGILQPIRDLVSASGRWAKGDFDYQVNITQKDEIARLEETFNFMASSLKERDDKLREYTDQQIMKSERLATIGQLAAGVAHEINNPLGTISLYAQMVLDELGEDSDSCRESIAVVMKQTNRAGRIVKDLLEFARQSEPEMRMLNINDVLTKAIAITTHPAELQNIRLLTDLTPELPDIQGDSDKLQQVFVNIIVNALQAMPEGGTLTVRTRMTEDSGFVEIEISDTGCGIPQEHLSKLFDPFFSTKRTGEGTGLGLSVTIGIVQKHSGTIDVKSKVGEGSTFIIRLPAEDN